MYKIYLIIINKQFAVFMNKLYNKYEGMGLRFEGGGMIFIKI